MPRLWSNKHTLVKRLIRTKNRENCPFQDGISLLQNKTNWIPLIQSLLLQEKEKKNEENKRRWNYLANFTSSSKSNVEPKENLKSM